MTTMPADRVGESAGRAGSKPPAALRQPLQGLAKARWVLAHFGGFFGLVWGPIFNLKEAGTQVQYTVNQTKEI